MFYAAREVRSCEYLKEKLAIEVDKLAAACVQAVVSGAGSRAVNKLIIELDLAREDAEELRCYEVNRRRAVMLAWSKLRTIWTSSRFENDWEAAAREAVLKRIAIVMSRDDEEDRYNGGDGYDWDPWDFLLDDNFAVWNHLDYDYDFDCDSDYDYDRDDDDKRDYHENYDWYRNRVLR